MENEKSENFRFRISGGEGEIRTLEPFYRLHDFQFAFTDTKSALIKVLFLIFNIDFYIAAGNISVKGSNTFVGFDGVFFPGYCFRVFC